MKPRNTFIILVVLAALIAYLVYDQQQPAATPTPTPIPSVQLLNLNDADVTGFVVTSGVSRTVAHKDANGWQLDEPIKDEGDSGRLNSLVSSLVKLSASRALTETPSNLAPFGLITGTYTLELKLKDGRSETVRLGDATLGGGNYYAQHVGDPKVYLIAPSIYGDLRRLIEQPPQKPTPEPTPLPPLPPLPPITPAATSAP
ncbi:MAG: DUF4340 domain-containing protein [Chloroflexota bacterium]